ncbi:hypothetical protein GWK47_047894 [Chionoecetes opilio]|uniref:Uncharacterized protein n=1 Tax=Chionoecetes opilio TaxID=41210 RepID=A0A8J4YD90_CHIOP|nr:hypothetical protein GWK47_047894 [Chionoecetes opilio]
MQAPCTMASVRSRGVKNKEGEISVPDARFVHPLQRPLQPSFCQSNPSLQDPKKELGVIFSFEGTAMRSSDRQRRDGRVFRKNAGTTSQVSPGSQFHNDLSAACSLPGKFRAR